MSKNTSPQARRAKSAPSRSRIGKGVSSRVRQESNAVSGPRDQQDRSTIQGRLRAFLPVSIISNVIVVSFVLILALTGILLSNSSFIALPATVAQLWLIANNAPVASSSTHLGIVPLLPSVGVVALVAWRVFRVVKDRVSLADLYVLLACVVGVPTLLTLTACAMLLDASLVLPVAVPHVGLAVLRTVMLHVIAFGFGMGPRLWRALLKKFGLPASIYESLRVAIRYGAGLLAMGLIATLVSLGAHASTVSEVLRGYPDSSAAGNTIALSVLYLPNLAYFAAAILASAEFVIGAGSVGLFGTFLVPLPPLPILAAVPASSWSFAWVLMLLPLLWAGFVSYKFVQDADRPIRDVAYAAGWVLLFAIVAWLMCAGQLGQYGFVGPVWWMAMLSFPLWLLVGGLVLVGLRLIRSRGGAEGGEVLVAAPHVTEDNIEEREETETVVTEGENEPDVMTEADMESEEAETSESGEETQVEEAPDEPDTLESELNAVETSEDETVEEESGAEMKLKRVVPTKDEDD